MRGVVSGLWVYPVKSMRGQKLDAAELQLRGIAGDRLYAVRDEAGKFGSGKTTRRFARMEGLARWSARISGAGVEVRPPDGDWLDGAGDVAAARLTTQVGRPVTVAREAEISHFDAGAIHIVTSADLATLRQFAGATPAAETFRPNLLIETQERSADWLGRTLRIGAVELEVAAPTERCLMVNFAPDGGRGPDFLRPIAQRLDECLGVYASVVRAGRIALGECVTVP